MNIIHWVLNINKKVITFFTRDTKNNIKKDKDLIISLKEKKHGSKKKKVDTSSYKKARSTKKVVGNKKRKRHPPKKTKDPGSFSS